MVDSQTDLFFARRMQFIDHFLPFLASVCQWDKPSAHQPLVLLQTDFFCLVCLAWKYRLKTIGFKNRFPSETEKHHINHWFFCRRSLTCQLWDSTRCLKTIGWKTNTSCETQRDALKPLVWRKSNCETRRNTLKPLVWRRTPVVRHNSMP